mmetsp:Transcript_53064/g.108166  ORF Transcript_53064/g.108166 Transcript_53064/m.108166 type:complete len:265 (+) Transcript_53064:442-1236(+)
MCHTCLLEVAAQDEQLLSDVVDQQLQRVRGRRVEGETKRRGEGSKRPVQFTLLKQLMQTVSPSVLPDEPTQALGSADPEVFCGGLGAFVHDNVVDERFNLEIMEGLGLAVQALHVLLQLELAHEVGAPRPLLVLQVRILLVVSAVLGSLCNHLHPRKLSLHNLCPVHPPKGSAPQHPSLIIDLQRVGRKLAMFSAVNFPPHCRNSRDCPVEVLPRLATVLALLARIMPSELNSQLRRARDALAAAAQAEGVQSGQASLNACWAE